MRHLPFDHIIASCVATTPESWPCSTNRCGMHSISVQDITFGEETTPYGRRARLTGEPRWLARRLLSRGGGLGLDPCTPEQARFQAFLAWCLWGEPSSATDPGGAANRLLSYSFVQSQGPDYWEIGGREVSRTSHNIPAQIVGFPDTSPRSSPPHMLPGLVLEKVDGRHVLLRHEPTGGQLRASLSDRSRTGRDPAGYWRPITGTPYRYSNVPEITADAAVLLAGLVPRLIAYGQLSWLNMGKYDIAGPSMPNFVLRRMSGSKWVLGDGSAPTSHALVVGMFSLSGMLPARCTFHQVEPELSVVRHRDAELWIAAKGTSTASPDRRWKRLPRRSTQQEWSSVSSGYQPYPGP